MESTMLFNATNSIGPIYQKEYDVHDGLFHSANDGFENNDMILRNTPNPNLVNTSNCGTRECTYVKRNTKPYEEATIDNLTIGGLYKNANKDFIGSVGVGIIPLLNKDGSLEDAILNIMVETVIHLECTSHGTNLLMGKYDRPQPNTLFSSLSVDKVKWNSKYSIAGAPAVDQTTIEQPVDYYHTPAPSPRPETPPEPVHQPQPKPQPQHPTQKPPQQPPHEQPKPQPKPQQPKPQQPKPQQQPQPKPGPSRPRKRPNEETDTEAKRQKKWYDDGEVVIVNGIPVTIIRAEKIPGQKKITSAMSDEEKLRIARENENLRQGAIAIAEQESKKKIQLTGKFLNLGIPEGGYYIEGNEQHRQSILNTATTPKPPQAPPKEVQKPPHKEPEPQPEKIPETEPKKQRQWLSITYKGLHFRIILSLGPTTSVNTAEAQIHVDRLPTTNEEVIELYGTSEGTIWTNIRHTLHELKEDEKIKIYKQILESYRNERHGNLK